GGHAPRERGRQKDRKGRAAESGQRARSDDTEPAYSTDGDARRTQRFGMLAREPKPKTETRTTKPNGDHRHDDHGEIKRFARESIFELEGRSRSSRIEEKFRKQRRRAESEKINRRSGDDLVGA